MLAWLTVRIQGRRSGGGQVVTGLEALGASGLRVLVHQRELAGPVGGPESDGELVVLHRADGAWVRARQSIQW